MGWEEKSYIGRGVPYIRKRGSSEEWRDGGNISQCQVAYEEDEQFVPNYRQGGGGKANSQRRVSAVNASLTFLDFTGKNQAIGLLGISTDVSSSVIADEEQNGYPAGLVPTDSMVDEAETMVVVAKDGDDASAWEATTDYGGAGEPAYAVPTSPNTYYYKATDAGQSSGTEPATWPTVEGDTVVDGTVTWTCMGLIIRADYTINTGGPLMDDDSLFEAGRPLKIGYTSLAGENIEALTDSSQEYEIRVVGLNDMQSGSKVLIDFYRWKPGGTQGIDYIGIEPGENALTGEALADGTITTPGLSQYMRVQQQ